MSRSKWSLLSVIFFCLGSLAIIGHKIELLDKILLVTFGSVAVACIILTITTKLGQRPSGNALWRLDHYLPFARKRHQRAGPPSRIVSWTYRWLPRNWFFNPETGEEGALRLRLRQLGPTVLAAPWRRLIQAVCFVLFLLLFFYVCWPYDAIPRSKTDSLTEITFQEFNQQSGSLTFQSSAPLPNSLQPNTSWHLEIPSSAPSTPSQSVQIQIESRTDNTLVLRSIEDAEAALWDSIIFLERPLKLFDHPRPFWPAHHADNLQSKEFVPADLFLIIDPLVAISTALASKNWVWSLTAAAGILILCLLIPRGFCGYICPLGTTIDLFDRFIGRHIKRFRTAATGWWVHLKYYILFAVILTSLAGELTSGYVAAIPVITRALLFLGEPLQTLFLRGSHLIPPMNSGHILSLLLFLCVLGLGLFSPRFWCKYVCPSGALFSLGNWLRITERKVEESCIHCNKCVTVCPFDAIKPDFTTRTTDCTQCQTCGGVCPTHSIKFVERWNDISLKSMNVPPTRETAIGRRSFLSWTLGSAGALAAASLYTGFNRATRAHSGRDTSYIPIRPPGSIPEDDFLQQCIRCGECFKVCPNNVLQPLGFEQGIDGLWTPEVKPDWAGCDSSCNNCGQVCPTGAIRALPLEEKKAARIGLAIVDEEACLPFANRESCQLCVDECNAAGYHAIEFTQVNTELDDNEFPIPGTGFLAPVVLAEKCVGCGLCQTRCFGINFEDKALLSESAIIVSAGQGKEDRIKLGSYIKARKKAPPKNDPIQTTPLDSTTAPDPFADIQ